MADGEKEREGEREGRLMREREKAADDDTEEEGKERGDGRCRWDKVDKQGR